MFKVLFGDYFLNYFPKLLSRNDSLHSTCDDRLPASKTCLEGHLRQTGSLLTLVGRMQVAEHSSTVHLEAPQLCNCNYLFVSSLMNAILRCIKKLALQRTDSVPFIIFPYSFIQWPHFIFMLQTCVYNS